MAGNCCTRALASARPTARPAATSMSPMLSRSATLSFDAVVHAILMRGQSSRRSEGMLFRLDSAALLPRSLAVDGRYRKAADPLRAVLSGERR
mgnify:CR=1 FL=1